MISLKNSLNLLSVRSCFVKALAREVKLGHGSRLFSTSSCRHKQDQETYPPNSSLEIGPIYNRNPRNLEKLRIGEKPSGWTLEKDGKLFWNKLVLEISNKQVKARVEHFMGQKPVKVSSQEWCIAKHLYSTKDLTAIETVGRIFAQRCLEAGIPQVYVSFTKEDLAKEKIKLFIRAMEEEGLQLEEGKQFNRSELVHLQYKSFQERSWEVFEELDEKILSKIQGVATTANSSSSK